MEIGMKYGFVEGLIISVEIVFAASWRACQYRPRKAPGERWDKIMAVQFECISSGRSRQFL